MDLLEPHAKLVSFATVLLVKIKRLFQLFCSLPYAGFIQ